MTNDYAQNDPIPEDPMIGDPKPADEPGYPYGFPGLRMGSGIPHYYGDYIRQIFVIVGVVLLVIIPFLDSRFDALMPFVIGTALVLVTLGAMVSPRKPWVILASGVTAAIGVLIFELLAINAFRAGAMYMFIAFEAMVIAFLFALYFSVKTYRSMSSGIIGRQPKFGEITKK